MKKMEIFKGCGEVGLADGSGGYRGRLLSSLVEVLASGKGIGTVLHSSTQEEVIIRFLHQARDQNPWSVVKTVWLDGEVTEKMLIAHGWAIKQVGPGTPADGARYYWVKD